MHIGVLQGCGCREDVWRGAGCVNDGGAGARQSSGVRSKQRLAVEWICPVEAGLTSRVVDCLRNLEGRHLHPLQRQVRVKIDGEKSVSSTDDHPVASAHLVSEAEAGCKLSGAGLADGLRKTEAVGAFDAI